MFPIITSLTYLPFAWTANNFIFLRNYKKRIIKYTETDVRKCIHYIVWFPTKLLIVMKTKFSYSLQNKPHYIICVKSCVCASFFLSFFLFLSFSFPVWYKLLDWLIYSFFLWEKKNTSSAQKAVCVKRCFFFTPHLLTLGWLNFCPCSSLRWKHFDPYLQAGFDWGKNKEYQPMTRLY